MLEIMNANMMIIMQCNSLHSFVLNNRLLPASLMNNGSVYESSRKGLRQTLGVMIGTILLSSALPAVAILNSQGVLADDGSESNSSADATGAVTEAHSDFNGDGYDDLAIGVPLENVGSTEDAGAVNVIYGSSSGLSGSAAADGTGRSDQLWHQNSAGVEDNAEASDMFGSAIAAGNFNGDNFMDLAIGVPGESIGTASGAGAVQVLYGSSAGLRTSSPSDQIWTQNSASIDNSAGSGDGFGSSLVAGDFNNDGRDDLAIGIANEDVGGIFDTGAVSVIYGSSVGLRATSPADQFWHQGRPGIEDTEEDGDGFGSLSSNLSQSAL
jgi:hypothetical protein